MKKTVKLSLPDNGYDIVIGRNILYGLGAKLKALKIGTDAVVITNPVIKKYYGKTVAQSLKKKGLSVKFLEVPAGEKSKSAQCAHQIIEKIVAYAAFRKVFIVALGGGVVGDLAGYIAAVYKRGIPYVQVPTTLLAQIDSSIGGKVAIDLPAGKNLIGAFYQPRLVWSDVSVLMTLDERQIRSGLAEAIKYGIIADRSLLDFIMRDAAALKRLDPKALVYLVQQCSQIKASVVAADEKETLGIRTILNFGHTVGHAIEAAAAYDQYQHGEAVALGMRVAADISLQMKMCSVATVDRINQALSEFQLPASFSGVTVRMIMQVLKNDKKFIAGKNRFVLAKTIGKVQVKEGIPLPVVRKAIRQYLKK
jgi:3-dehydroquinate synthase